MIDLLKAPGSSPGIGTRIRLLEVMDEEKYLADRAQSQRLALSFLDVKADRENLIVNAGMQSVANYMAGLQTVYEDLRWYAQALGTSTTTPTASDVALGAEVYRVQYTDFSPTVSNPTGRIITMNTYFTTSSFSNFASTVSNATTPTLNQFSLTAVSGVPAATSFPLAVGDLIRIQTPVQYEYKTVQSIAGNLVTLTTNLANAPVVGATVAQCTEEAGFFGNKPASLTAGSIAVTNGSAAVVGTGTAFSNTYAGDFIRFPSSTVPRTWFQILTVNSNTSITLTSNFTGTTIASGGSYACRGTMFNHVNGLRYIKETSKGFVFENQWTIGG